MPAWLLYSRGAGRTIKNAAQKIERKSAKWNSNFFNFKSRDVIIDYRESGANGAAMRILPICLANFNDFEKIKKEVFANSIVTHGHSRAIVGALLLAYVVNLILPIYPEDFNPENFIIKIGQDFQKKFELTFLNEPSFASWINEWNKGSQTTFHEQFDNTLLETQDQLRLLYKALTSKLPIHEVLKQLGCIAKGTKGSGTATVLASIFLTCKFHNNPINGIIHAVNYLGSDTDSIAAFTGSLLGALHGQSIIPEKWKMVQDFEYLDKIANDLLLISENNFHGKEEHNNNSLKIFDINKDNYSINENIYFEPLGHGLITKIERYLPMTKGKYNLIIDVEFKIGQSCRFSKLIAGSMPNARNEQEVILMIKEKIQKSRQDSLIAEIIKINNPELNDIIIKVLKSLL